MPHHSQTNQHFNFTLVGVGLSSLFEGKKDNLNCWTKFETHPCNPVINDNWRKTKLFDYHFSALNSNFIYRVGLKCTSTFFKGLYQLAIQQETHPYVNQRYCNYFLFC
jgi:hypothetical protein